tara:strand:+ start:2978 stop:4345 length:1368 start_codon:yes stop_codon:yes gene_type:complete
MDRLTGSGAKSLKEAYSKVYAQPEVEQLNEQVKLNKDGVRYSTGDYGSRKEGQVAVKNGMRVKWTVDKDGKGEWVPDVKEFKPNLQYVGATGGQTKRIDPTLDDSGQPLPKADKPVKPVKSARQQELDAINADKNLTPMQKWAKANPKLAAAKAERDRTRGTSASANPMLDGNKKVPALRSGMPSAKPTPPQSSSPNAGKPVTGTGSVQGTSLRQEIDSVRNRLQQVKTGTTQIPTGDTIQTKMNPDSSLSVTQKRSPEATRKIKQSLELQSADLFDIVKGEFINEGYSEEDTMYMMANLNEEQLQEFMKYVQGAVNIGKRIPGVRGVINKVGSLFGRKPVAPMPAGQVGALRLYQDKANRSIQRLNQQTPKLDARAATREKNRLNNLNPTAVSNRNSREAAAQIRQRNRELGRPESAGVQPVDRLDYKPGDPMFDDFVKRHHANKRGGVVKFTD